MPAKFAVKIAAIQFLRAPRERVIVLPACPGALFAHPLDDAVQQML
jgi:hypothetical protein